MLHAEKWATILRLGLKTAGQSGTQVAEAFHRSLKASGLDVCTLHRRVDYLAYTLVHVIIPRSLVRQVHKSGGE